MKCPYCGSEELLCPVHITVMCSPAKRGGSIKVGGVKVTQVDIKDAWNKDPAGNDKPIKGPFKCADCGESSFYVDGAPSNLYKGDMVEAEAVGPEFFVDGNTLPEDE